MGLFDMVTEKIASAGGFVEVAKTMSSFIDQNGGVSGLMQKFEQEGFGSAVKSWISTGENQALTADAVKKVFGNEQVAKMAEGLGITADDAAAKVSSLLPTLVDKLSPNGELPATANIMDAVKNFDVSGLLKN